MKILRKRLINKKQINVINQVMTDNYAIYHGDSIEISKALPSNSIHFSIFSL